MDNIRKTIISMQRALASLNNAVVEVDEEEKNQQDQINTLEEHNRLLSSKNRRLSVANQRISLLNRKLIGEKNVQHRQISEFSKKLKESNASITKLQNENDSLKRDGIMSWDNQARLLNQNQNLQRDINDLITCQICSEQFQSAGEHIPCKLKCQHIMCKKCAEQWLQRGTGRANCPTCNKLYSQKHISPIKLNYDL